MGCCTGNRNFDDKYLEKMTIKVNIWLIRKVMAKIQKNLTAESICFKKIYS